VSEEVNDWTLFVFVRTCLESMNAGKAQAHSGHASNAFVYRYLIEKGSNSMKHGPAVSRWMASTNDGFGTQMNLKADDWKDIHTLHHFGIQAGYACGMVEDPTYPFEVTKEVFSLMKDEYKKDAVLKGDRYVCFRPEDTAFFIFGRRSDPVLASQIKKFKLHP
jgi:hypothetical protein